MPLDRPPVQSYLRRRFALVHTARDARSHFQVRDGRSLEKIARGLHFRKRQVGASGGNTGNSDLQRRGRIQTIALTRGQEQNCEGPNLTSAAAAASRGQVVRSVKSRRAEHRRNRKSNRRCMIRGGRLPDDRHSARVSRCRSCRERGGKPQGRRLTLRLSAVNRPIAARRNVEAGSSGGWQKVPADTSAGALPRTARHIRQALKRTEPHESRRAAGRSARKQAASAWRTGR